MGLWKSAKKIGHGAVKFGGNVVKITPPYVVGKTAYNIGKGLLKGDKEENKIIDAKPFDIPAKDSTSNEKPIPITLPEYDLARKRVNSDFLSAQNNMKEAMSRRFARLGGGPSGAQIKMEQEAIGKLNEERQKTDESILASETTTRRALEEAQKDRNLKIRALDQADRQFELDKKISEFNKQLAKLEAGRPTDLFGQLFGKRFSTDRIKI